MQRKYTFVALASLSALTATVFVACDSDPSSELPDDNPAVTTASSGDGGEGGDNLEGGFNASGGSGGDYPGDSCGEVQVEPLIEQQPADIIFVIDNSGSMSDEIASVVQNINVNFAQIIQASGIDYQVIMLTDHGPSSLEVCITAPLSGNTDCSVPPVDVPGQFYHYDINVQSHDSLCIALDTMFGVNGGGEADENGNHQNGWGAVLRQEAVKVFVEISDDGISCSWDGNTFNDSDQVQPGQQVALDWDSALLALNPVQFGTQSNRNYLFYSIVGLPSNSTQTAYSEFDPVVTGNCQGAYGSGTGYQWLSKGTGALRFPVCSYQSYDSVFQDIAAGVIDVTAVPCEFDLPAPPPGQEYDYFTVDVTYTPGGSGAPQSFVKVDSPGLCMPGAFYMETNNHVVLCPQACTVVSSDKDAEVKATVDCYIPTK